ncbi:MAG: hypothetical protein AAF618_12170 [Pseudomonadota bacterium]
MRLLSLLTALVGAPLLAQNGSLNDLEGYFAMHAAGATWIAPTTGRESWQVEVNGVLVTKFIAVDGTETYSAEDISGLPSPICAATWLTQAQSFATNCAAGAIIDESALAVMSDKTFAFIAGNAFPPLDAEGLAAAFRAIIATRLRDEAFLCEALAPYAPIFGSVETLAREAISQPRLPVAAECS